MWWARGLNRRGGFRGGDRPRRGKYADCESSWLPECRRRSNIVHKGGNTRGRGPVAPSLKRLSTRRALAQGRVSHHVTTYCEDLSAPGKACGAFLPSTPENPPGVSSRDSLHLPPPFTPLLTSLSLVWLLAPLLLSSSSCSSLSLAYLLLDKVDGVQRTRSTPPR